MLPLILRGTAFVANATTRSAGLLATTLIRSTFGAASKTTSPMLTALVMMKRIHEWREQEMEDADGSPTKKGILILATAAVAAATGLVLALRKILQDWVNRDTAEPDSIQPDPAINSSPIVNRLKSLLATPEVPVVGDPIDTVRRAPRKKYAPDLSEVDTGVQSSIKEASRISGIKANVLFAIANKESRLGKFLTASTTSARGLFQLTRGTFKELVDKYGAKYDISYDDVNDHRANSIMGALYLRDLAILFKKRYDRTVSITELYLMYMLGPTGGLNFIDRMTEKPSGIVENDMPTAARNNPSVFYSKSKQPRTYREVFEYLSTTVEDVGHSLIATYPDINETSPYSPVQKLAERVPPSPQLVVREMTKKETTTRAVPSAAPKVEPSPPKSLKGVPRSRTKERPVRHQSSHPPNRPPQSLKRLKNGLVVADS